MILDALCGRYFLPDSTDLHEIRDVMAMFRNESPADRKVNLSVGMGILKVTPGLVEMAFAELANLAKLDIAMAKNRDATELFIKTIREKGSGGLAGQA